jgi:hypothetical protein
VFFVIVQDSSLEALGRGLGQIEKNLSLDVKKKKISTYVLLSARYLIAQLPARHYHVPYHRCLRRHRQLGQGFKWKKMEIELSSLISFFTIIIIIIICGQNPIFVTAV